MSRMYSVTGARSVTAAFGDVDWLEIGPGDDKPCRLRRLVLSQTSEVGDAQEEGLEFTITRVPATATSGSGGSSPTPTPLDDIDSAAGFTAETFNDTVATTTGALTNYDRFGWNVRNSPFEIVWPDPEMAPVVRQGSLLVVRQATTVADTIDALITAYIEEI